MITVSHPTVNWYVRALLKGRDECGQKIAEAKVRQHPYREAVRLLGRRFRQEWLIRCESGRASVDAVAQAFDLQVAKCLGETAGGRVVHLARRLPLMRVSPGVDRAMFP
jgi:hypothetical protein